MIMQYHFTPCEIALGKNDLNILYVYTKESEVNQMICYHGRLVLHHHSTTLAIDISPFSGVTL